MHWVERGIAVGAPRVALDDLHSQVLEDESCEFVVLTRDDLLDHPRYGLLHYVFHRNEFLQEYWHHVDLGSLPAWQALGVREVDASSKAPLDGRPEQLAPPPAALPEPLITAARAVALDGAGTVVAVGLPEPVPGGVRPLETDLGPVRSANGPTRGITRGHRPQAVEAEEPEGVDVILSAQGPAQIVAGQEDVIDVRVELAAGATPLAQAVPASIAPDEPLTAILSIADGGLLAAPEGRILRLAAPAEGRPTVSAFLVRGLAEGRTSVVVLFRQGGSDLGQVRLEVNVVARKTTEALTEASAAAEARDTLDDQVVALLIEEEVVGDQIRYRCLVTAEVLGLDNAEYASTFVQARAGSAASASLAYVHSIYRRIVERALLNAADLDLFQRELKAIGTELSTQLLSGDLARILWEHREDIVTVKVTSFEPYIPWELLRLKHPDTNETDERHLAEYGLVRSLSGRAFPKKLRAADWRYLVGTYPNDLHPAVGREVDYLTTALVERRRIEPRPIQAEAAAFLDALASPDFDVLHVACHGKTDLDDVESAELVIGDRLLAGREVGPVSVSATTVREEAKLRERAPLVFLNACQSGQQAPSLTDFGGWPRAFFTAGAGAFVGTSWEVHENPAATFAESFYEALLDGGTLADAAAKARSEAKKARDASWLAFSVYGQPTARVS